MKQKVLSLLLTFAMVFSLVPSTAFADDGNITSDNTLGAEEINEFGEQLQKLENEAEDLADMAIFEAEDEDVEQDELGQSFNNLTDTINQSATDILIQTGVAITTGAALTATKVAAIAVRAEVENLEGKSAQKAAQIAELEQVIQEAHDAIKAAQDDVDDAGAVLQAAQDEVDALPGLDEAQEQLSVAENALEDAERIVAELEGILAELDPAKANIDILNSDVADEEKVAAKVALVECIFAQDETFGWVDEGLLIFAAGGAYYQLEESVDESGATVVQFRELDKSVETTTTEVSDDDINSLKNSFASLPAYDRTYKQTELTAVENESTSYAVLVRLKSNRSLELNVLVGSSVVKLEKNQGAWSFTTRGSGMMARPVKHSVSLVTTVESVGFTPTEEVYSTTSLSVMGDWNDATDQLSTAITDRDAAAAEKDAAEAQVQDVVDKIAARDEAQDALAEAENVLEETKANNDTSAAEEELAQAEQDLKDINKQLKGNLIEQLIVALIHEDTDEFSDALSNFDPTEYLSESEAASYRKYSASSSLVSRALAATLYAKALAAVSNEAKEQAAPILDVIKTVRENGGLSLETASAVYNLLTSDGLSANTKLAIVEALSDYLGNTYESAQDRLKEVIAEGRDNMSEAAKDTASSIVTTIVNEGAAGLGHIAQSAGDALSRAFNSFFRPLSEVA